MGSFNLGSANFAFRATGLENLTHQITGLGRQIVGLINPTNTLIGLLSGIVSGAAVGRLIGLSAAMETTRISFESFFKTAEETEHWLGKLREWADWTPLSEAQTYGAARMLFAFNRTVDDIIPDLQMLGDVATGTQRSISELAYSYGRMSRGQRVFNRDLQMLEFKGVPIYRELAKVLKTNEDGVRAMATAGTVNFKHIQEAFQNMTKEGGQYHKFMFKLATTLESWWIGFKDVLETNILRPFGDAMVAGLKLKKILETIVEKGMKPLAASTAFKDFVKRFEANLTRITDRVRDFLLSIDWSGVLQRASRTFTAIRDLAFAIGSYLLTYYQKIMKMIGALFGTTTLDPGDLFDSLLERIEGITAFINDNSESISDWIAGFNTVATVLGTIVGAFAGFKTVIVGFAILKGLFLSLTSPIGLTVLGITMVIKALASAKKMGMVEYIADIIRKTSDWIQKSRTFRAVIDNIQTAFTAIKTITHGVVRGINWMLERFIRLNDFIPRIGADLLELAGMKAEEGSVLDQLDRIIAFVAGNTGSIFKELFGGDTELDRMFLTLNFSILYLADTMKFLALKLEEYALDMNESLGKLGLNFFGDDKADSLREKNEEDQHKLGLKMHRDEKEYERRYLELSAEIARRTAASDPGSSRAPEAEAEAEERETRKRFDPSKQLRSLRSAQKSLREEWFSGVAPERIEGLAGELRDVFDNIYALETEATEAMSRPFGKGLQNVREELLAYGAALAEYANDTAQDIQSGLRRGVQDRPEGEGRDGAQHLTGQRIRRGTTTGYDATAQGAKRLMDLGFEGDQILPILDQIMAVAMNLQIPFNALATQFARIGKNGTASFRELYAVQKQGIPIFEALAASLDKPIEEIMRMAAAGDISTDQFRKAFEHMVNEGMRPSSEEMVKFFGRIQRAGRVTAADLEELEGIMESDKLAQEEMGKTQQDRLKRIQQIEEATAGMNEGDAQHWLEEADRLREEYKRDRKFQSHLARSEDFLADEEVPPGERADIVLRQRRQNVGRMGERAGQAPQTQFAGFGQAQFVGLSQLAEKMQAEAAQRQQEQSEHQLMVAQTSHLETLANQVDGGEGGGLRVVMKGRNNGHGPAVMGA